MRKDGKAEKKSAVPNTCINVEDSRPSPALKSTASRVAKAQMSTVHCAVGWECSSAGVPGALARPPLPGSTERLRLDCGSGPAPASGERRFLGHTLRRGVSRKKEGEWLALKCPRGTYRPVSRLPVRSGGGASLPTEGPRVSFPAKGTTCRFDTSQREATNWCERVSPPLPPFHSNNQRKTHPQLRTNSLTHYRLAPRV